MLKLRHPWTRQPQVPVKPDQRWIDRGLVFAYSQNRIVYQRGGIAVMGQSTSGTRVSQMGVGADFSGSGSHVTSWRDGSVFGDAFQGSRAVTMVSVHAADAATSEARFLGTAEASSGNTLFSIEVVSGAYRFQIRNEASSTVNLVGGSVTLGRACTIVARLNGTGGEMKLFSPDGSVATATGPGGTVELRGIAIGARARGTGPTISQAFDGWLGDQFVFTTALTDDECIELRDNPAALWEPLERRIWVPVGGGGVTGTLAKTEGADTSAASGTTTVTGTLARTNAADTSAASGTTTVTGTLARTNAADTLSASGSAGQVSGTLSTTNAADTVAASGTTTVTGTLARTSANDTLVASGIAGAVSGTLAYTNAPDTVVGAGTTTVKGTVAVTAANDTLVASDATTTLYFWKRTA